LGSEKNKQVLYGADARFSFITETVHTTNVIRVHLSMADQKTEVKEEEVAEVAEVAGVAEVAEMAEGEDEEEEEEEEVEEEEEEEDGVSWCITRIIDAQAYGHLDIFPRVRELTEVEWRAVVAAVKTKIVHTTSGASTRVHKKKSRRPQRRTCSLCRADPSYDGLHSTRQCPFRITPSQARRLRDS